MNKEEDRIRSIKYWLETELPTPYTPSVFHCSVYMPQYKVKNQELIKKNSMKTIETLAAEKYHGQRELPAHKQIPAENFIDWAQFGAREAQRWIPVSEELPEEGLPCIVKNQADNKCICFMKSYGNSGSLGWFNYWYDRSGEKINETPIRAIVTHWRYVERKL